MIQSEVLAAQVIDKEKKPTVLVTDANRGSAIAIIRSLSRQDWRTIAADSKDGSLGFHSRYAARTLVYPSPTHDAMSFANSILEVVIKERVDLVIPTTDDAILPLALARKRFEGLCKLAIPDEEALRLVTDKHETLALARELGVPTPPTYVATTVEEARDVAHLLPWPMVLKAQRSRSLTSDGEILKTGPVGYANNVKELIEEIQRLQQFGPVLVQKYCEGSGLGVELLAHEGRTLAAFQHRRLAEIPITGGASALRESVPLNPELYEYSRRLVEALRWTGLLMVEFKVSKHETTLMEINGRVWGSLPLAVHSGMDFPARLAELYRQGPPPPETPLAREYAVGVRACNLELMLLWIAQVASGRRRYEFIPQPQRREAFRALLGLFDPRQKYDLQAFRDPVPGFLQFFRAIQKLGRKAQASV